MGLNGMGKSTLIQSLLLLRQSADTDLRKLKLNGDLVNIGHGKDALYNFADSDKLAFGLNFDIEGKQSECELEYQYSKENDVLNLYSNKDSLLMPVLPLFSNKFIFLNAERKAPATDYEMSVDKVENLMLGIHGELAVHFLSRYGEEIQVADNLCLSSTPSKFLIHQVQSWMNVISPGIDIDIKDYQDIDRTVISYGFKTDSISTNKFRPTNVGFGISYILPVLVACLCGKYELIIMENPEAHLHPKGQAKMGELMARCADCGTQLFIETHSDHLLNGIRVAVKEKVMSANDVRINYFTKTVEDGQNFTKNHPIRIGVNGALSEYPDDFIDEWENQLMKLL